MKTWSENGLESWIDSTYFGKRVISRYCKFYGLW